MTPTPQPKVRGVRTGHGRVQLWALDDGWVELPDLEFASRRWAPVALSELIVFVAAALEAKQGFAWAKPAGATGLALFLLGLVLFWSSNARMRWRTGRDLRAEVAQQVSPTGGHDAGVQAVAFVAGGRRLRRTWPGSAGPARSRRRSRRPPGTGTTTRCGSWRAKTRPGST